MTVRTDLIVDWSLSPRVITVEAPSTEITIQDLHHTCRWLEAEPVAMDNKPLIDSSGLEALGGGTSVGITSTLQNALVAFEARPGLSYIQCSISGGNVVAIDNDGTYFKTPIHPTAFTQVVITASSSATTQSQAQLEYSTFNGGVTIDLIKGKAGVAYPRGTPGDPSNNVEDAHIIATDRGFVDFFIKGDLTLGAGDFSDGHRWVGTSKVSTLLTIESLANITTCIFENMSIQGVMDNEVDIINCLIKDISYFNGFISDSALAGTIVLGGGVSAHIYDCKSGLINNSSSVIDMGGAGQSLALRGHSGDMIIRNKIGSNDKADINITGGTILIDATVTTGPIIVQGTGRLIDNSTGKDAVVNELVNGADIANLQRVVEMQRAHHTATGNIWYWDPINGDDNNDAKHISRPVATFAQAHNLAIDNNHDVIFAIPGSNAGVTTTTENLVISKNYLFLRGPGRDFTIKSADDLLDAIQITGDGVEVSSLSVSTSLTNTKDAIHTTGNFSYLHNLWVADAVNGLHFENGEYGIAENVKMHHNLGYGLKFSGTAGHVDIIDSHIGSNHLDNVVIDLDGTDHEVNFMGNTVIHSSVTGYGINISATSGGVIMHDEVVIFNNAAGGINDLSASTYNDRIEKVTEIWSHPTDGQYTAEDIMKITAAALGGKAAGLSINSPKYRNLNDDHDVISATTDVDGNRLSVVVSP